MDLHIRNTFFEGVISLWFTGTKLCFKTPEATEGYIFATHGEL
jgi:hypothetical protein